MQLESSVSRKIGTNEWFPMKWYLFLLGLDGFVWSGLFKDRKWSGYEFDTWFPHYRLETCEIRIN